MQVSPDRVDPQQSGSCSNGASHAAAAATNNNHNMRMLEDLPVLSYPVQVLLRTTISLMGAGSSSIDPGRYAVLGLTHVQYDPADPFAKLLALVTLSPIFLLCAYATIILYRRELTFVNAFVGQLGCEGLNWGLKRLIRQPRPTGELDWSRQEGPRSECILIRMSSLCSVSFAIQTIWAQDMVCRLATRNSWASSALSSWPTSSYTIHARRVLVP